MDLSLHHTGKEEDSMTSGKTPHTDKQKRLPVWLDIVTDSVVLMFFFSLAAILFSPILVVFGALYPLFRRYTTTE